MKIKIIPSTPIGPIRLIWKKIGGKPKIVRVVLPGTDFPDCKVGSCAEIDAVAQSLKVFLEGQEQHFPLELVDLKSCSPFQQSVLHLTSRIPWGRVSTYQKIAAELGTPRGSRAVGNALATNSFPLIIPCHRVIRSDGQLGGYAGGSGMKRILLAIERFPK